MSESPANQEILTGSAVTRWKPGQSGNPAGRKSAGLSIREEINALSMRKLTRAELRKIAKDRNEGCTRVIAAQRLLKAMECEDLADFEPALDGQLSLRELRAAGINTEAIKRVKVRRKKNEQGQEEVEREIELNQSAGVDFDRVMDRTEGKPRQTVELEGDALPASVLIVTPLAGGQLHAETVQPPALGQGEQGAGVENGDADSR